MHKMLTVSSDQATVPIGTKGLGVDGASVVVVVVVVVGSVVVVVVVPQVDPFTITTLLLEFSVTTVCLLRLIFLIIVNIDLGIHCPARQT